MYFFRKKGVGAQRTCHSHAKAILHKCSSIHYVSPSYFRMKPRTRISGVAAYCLVSDTFPEAVVSYLFRCGRIAIEGHHECDSPQRIGREWLRKCLQNSLNGSTP